MVAPKNEVGLPDILRLFAVVEGIVTGPLNVNPELWNAFVPILATKAGIVIDVNALQYWNA